MLPTIFINFFTCNFRIIEVGYIPNQLILNLLPAAGHDKGYTREIIAAEYKKPIQVGDIIMEVWPSDHDAYGATGLIPA